MPTTSVFFFHGLLHFHKIPTPTVPITVLEWHIMQMLPKISVLGPEDRFYADASVPKNRFYIYAEGGMACQLVQSFASLAHVQWGCFWWLLPANLHRLYVLTSALNGGQSLYLMSSHWVQWIKQGLLLKFCPCQNDYQAYSILGCMFSSFQWMSFMV